MSGTVPPAPLCACHGERACVHLDNGHPNPGGRDLARNWAWHCTLDAEHGCEGYSAVLIVAEEWLTPEERAQLTKHRKAEE